MAFIKMTSHIALQMGDSALGANPPADTWVYAIWTSRSWVRMMKSGLRKQGPIKALFCTLDNSLNVTAWGASLTLLNNYHKVL